MSDEIILNDNDGSSNILEYIEITNSGTGTLDATKDIVILEDYNPNVPVIRPPYIAEDIANKKNNLDNPNTTGYTSTLAVYNALLPFNNYTGATLPIINNAITGATNIGNKIGLFKSINNRNLQFKTIVGSGTTTIYNSGDNIVIYGIGNSGTTQGVSIQTFSAYTGNTLNKINYISGVTDQKLNIISFSNYTGITIPNNYYNKTQVDLLISGATSGQTGHLYEFISSGGTIIKTISGSTTDTITIYSPTGSTSSWIDLKDKPSWLSGNTLNDFETSHNHNQYLETSTFSNYTGTTIPNTYALKTTAITGGTNIGTGTYIFSGVTDNKLNAKSLKVAGSLLSINNTVDSITISASTPTTTVSFYDCTVGSGGTYTTINAAYSAGKRKLLITNNTSLSGDLTVDDNLYIYLDDYTLSANTYNFTISTGKILTIEGIGTIRFGYSSEKILFNGNVNVTGKGNSNKTLTIINSSTATLCRINDTGNFSNLIVNVPNLNYVGFGTNTSQFVGKLDYIYINSGGSSCIPIYGTGIGCFGDNLHIIGVFNFIGFYELTNFYANAAGTLYIHTGSNINITAGIIRGIFVIANFFCNSISQSRNGGSYVNGTVVANMSITQTSTIYSNVRFNGSITTDADSNKYIGCTVDGLFTLSSGAEYNVIQGNSLIGGLTNNSGNLTNVINSNI